MNKDLVPQKNVAAIERLLVHGDLAPMTEEQRLIYMKSMCKLMGIPMLGRPFDFIKLNGKLVMYANVSCASQLRAKHKISIKIMAREHVNGLYIVTAQAKTGKGREDESIGAVNCKGLSGVDLANAMLKAESKAKRRVTLSLCGLNLLDPDSAKELSDQEIKAAEVAVEVSTAKIAETTSRPEYEESPPPSVKAETATTAVPKVYTLKAGKIKGKRLEQVPLSKLAAWMEWYESETNAGKPLHADIQDDAFHIKAFLDEVQFMQLPLEGKNG